MLGDLLPVSLIVPVHAESTTFGRCIASIGATRPGPAEVIVVCDGEAERWAKLAEGEGFRVVRQEGPRGASAARNAGARIAAHPVLVFVDSDVEIPEDAILQVWSRLAGHPDLAGLFGSYDAEPAAPSVVSQYRNLLHHFVHQCSAPQASTFWSGFGALRREVFSEVGGFDERVRGIEDIELGYRLRRAGHQVQLDPSLQVKHLKRWTVALMLKTDILDRARPWGRLILEYGGAPHDLNLSASSRWSLAATAVLVLCLAGALVRPVTLVGAGGSALALLWLNRSFYRFLFAHRGVWFGLRSIPLHWIYYLCGGVGFALALADHASGRSSNRSPARGGSRRVR